jgi:cysteine-rich repeat protein
VAGLAGHVLVGAPGDNVGLVDGGAAYVFSGATVEAVFRKRLSPAAFGASVAAADGYVLVGAPHGDGGAGVVGRFDGASGAAVATLESPAPGDSSFGFSVAALGNDIVVGAPFLAAAEGPAVGAVYRFQGTALARVLGNPQPVPGDQFGFSLATIGSDVVVGVPLAGARDLGLAYLLDGLTGRPRVIFEKAIPVAGDFFGAAVAAEGNEVLVGAPLDSSSAPSAGAAYLFRRNTAMLERTFRSPAPAPGDLFGAAVALAGPRVVIGAPSVAGGAGAAGAVHVFDRRSGNLLATIQSPTPEPGDQFGSAVAAAGETVLVGAPGVHAAAFEAGAAYLFEARTGALQQALLNPAQGAFDHFGSAVAIGPAGLVVGAPGTSRVYVFRPIAQAASVPHPATIEAAVGEAQCGDGIVEPGEVCDDGNTVDTDDCRNDCSGPFCCTLDPLQQMRCDDNDPCTDDSRDPVAGCIHVPNGRCCQRDADCGSGMCRVCDGCFLYPWACCAQGSTCIALAPECAGIKCLAGAFCRCEGGLACPGEAVPERTETLFTAACDQVRLGQNLTPADASSPREELRLARSYASAARRMTRKAARATRKLMTRGGLSKSCGRTLLAKIRSVRRAIPRSRKLRHCVLAS